MILLINLTHKYDFWNIKTQHVDKIREAFPKTEVINCISTVDVLKSISRAEIYYGWNFPKEWLNISKNLNWIATPDP